MSSFVKAWIDTNFIQSTKGAGEILTQFEKNNTEHIIDKLPVENSILWTRNALRGGGDDESKEVQHDHMLVKLELDRFIELIEKEYGSNDDESGLRKFVRDAKNKAQVSQMTLLVRGLKPFLKSSQNSRSDSRAQETYNEFARSQNPSKKPSSKGSKPRLTKAGINSVLIDMQINERACVRSFEASEDLRDIVFAFTKSVGEYTNKHELAENMLLCETVEKSHTKVSKDGQGMINLWKEMLECFPLVSSDQAQAIAVKYPSPLILQRSFESASSQNEAKLLLADIQVRRGAGVLANVRRIGPELSQKVHKFFTSTDPNELLVND